MTEESTARITNNKLSRIGGMPPIIAVKDGSTATIRDNRITGGGAAAVLVQDKATITDNSFDGYRTAVNSSKATVAVTGNSIKQFRGTVIIVKNN